MRPSELQRSAARARLAGEQLEHHGPDILRRLGQWAGRGYPTGGQGAGGTPDPTGTTATTPPGPVDTLPARLTHATHDLARAADRVLDLIAEATPRTAITDSDRRHLADTDTGCDHCARSSRRHQRPLWSPVYRTGTVAGNLAHPLALCRWCYDWVLDTGGLAPTSTVLAHHDGRRITRPA